MEHLDGRVALVTGASRGVGPAAAVALAQAGCDVACAARSTRAAPQRTPGTLDDTVARVAAAGQLASEGVAVNCFRFDVPVASEGFVANAPGADHTNWEPSDVAAEGIVWMVRQPEGCSGRLESMFALRHREGIMASRVARPTTTPPPTHLFEGAARSAASAFTEPYPEGDRP